MRNEKIVNVKITRHELCDLMLACTGLHYDENGNEMPERKKWKVLHDKLRDQLNEWDEKHDDDGMLKH